MILPELRGTIEFYVVIASITMLAWVFAYVWTITKGGPGDATVVLELYIYNTGAAQLAARHGLGRRGDAAGVTSSRSRAVLGPLAQRRAGRLMAATQP